MAAKEGSAAKLSWDDALIFRKARLPSYVGQDGVRLMSYRSKVGRFCKDTKLNRCCTCNDLVSDFIPFGSAITSTFKLQITLITVFAILTVLALPAIVINTYGITAAGGAGSVVFSIASTTVGNLPIIPAMNASEAFIDLPLTKQTLSIPTAATLYASLDFIGVIVFVLAYAAVRNGLIEEDKQVNKNNVGPERYTIFLPDIPADTTEEDIRDWAVSVSKSKSLPEGHAVADVNIVDDDMGLLRLYTQRGQMFRGLARIDRFIKDLKGDIGDRKPKCFYDGQYAKLRVLERSFELLKKRADETTVKAQAYKSKGATAAFVTYEHPDARKQVLTKFPLSAVGFHCQPEKRRFKGVKVVVKGAPAPDTVQWANLNIKARHQSARQCLTGLLAGVLILFSFLFIVYASLTSASVQDSLAPPVCTDLSAAFRNGTYANTTKLLALDETDRVLKCYCPTLVWANRTYESVTDDAFASKCPEQSCTRLLTLSPASAIAVSYCYSWLYARAVALGLTAGASISIAVVNILLSMFMRLFTLVEGHHSSDDLNKSLVLRLFFAQFLNTAMLTIIINAAWDTITGTTLPIPGTGKYDDFSSGWYNSVGAAFHSTMITLAISPHIGTVMGMFGIFKAVKNAHTQIERREALAEEKRAKEEAAGMLAGGEDGNGPAAARASSSPRTHSDKKNKPLLNPLPVPRAFAVQADLNESFVGPPADYVLRYVQMLITVFVCYIFSAGMPLLMPIACASMVVSHLVDKAAFLYFHRRPPAANNGIVRYAVELLPVAALMHLGIGIWMLGSLSTFRDAVLSSTGLTAQFEAAQAYGGSILRTGILATGFKRITQVQSLPLLFLFAIVLVGLLLQVLLHTVGALLHQVMDAMTGGRVAGCLRKMAKCCKKKKESDAPLYSDAIQPPLLGTSGGINGVKSYNVLENPDLQSMFGISQEFAETHKGLRSVATFSVDDAIAAANASTIVSADILKVRVLSAFAGKAKGEDGNASESGDDPSGAFVHANPLRSAVAYNAGNSSGGLPLHVESSVRAGRGPPSAHDAARRLQSFMRRKLQFARNKIAARERRAMRAAAKAAKGLGRE